MTHFTLFLEAIQSIPAYQPLYLKASANDMEGCLQVIQSLPLSVLNLPLTGYRDFTLLMITWYYKSDPIFWTRIS